MQPALGHRGFIQSTAATGSFLVPHVVLNRNDLKSLQIQPSLSELPIVIEDHAFTTGGEKIHALYRGFHLAPAPQPYPDTIMTDPARLPIDHLIPSTTGSRFTVRA